MLGFVGGVTGARGNGDGCDTIKIEAPKERMINITNNTSEKYENYVKYSMVQ